MRRIYSFLLIVFFTLPVLAQNGTAPFYYFGTQKIALQQSEERLFIQLKNDQAANAVRNQLKAQFNLPDRVFSKLYEKQNWVIHLDQPVLKAKQKDILRYLQSNTAVAYCQTALKSAEGKDLICAGAFYVKLKATTGYASFAQFANQHQCTIVQAYAYDPTVFLLEATTLQPHVGILKANAFFESGLFEYAEPDFAGFDLIESVPPNDPFYNLQWNHINNTNTQSYNGIPGADLDVDLAWTVTQGNSSIRIAVIDVGVQRNHPDLVNNIDPLGYGIASGTTTTGDIIDTANYHGTACAGIIAATANNNIGIAGIAPLCKIIPVNIARNSTGAFGTFSQIAGAIDWAWNQGGADVLSNSWGGGTPSSLYRDAIKRAITNGRGGKGAVVVFASGNLNAGVSSPAIFPETIAVGAMTMCYERKSPSTCDGESTWGSNFGAGLDVVAPGVKIITTGINGTGTGTYAGYLTSFNGTSAACPMVAGVAALMLSVNSTLTQTSVKEIIERTARKVGNYTYGRAAGQPNGSWNNEMGHGLVNAYQAILAAQSNATYCTVSITANGNTRICSGASVSLQVASPLSGATYQWRKDGALVQNGTSIAASVAGNYDVLLTATNGCKDTSSVIAVSIGLPEGTLRADAGRDTVVCQNSNTILGGGPAAAGGTPFIQTQRGLAYSVSENAFYRFDPNLPSLSFKQIKTNFYSGANSNTLICGSAATPFGLYMLVRNTNQFIKVDTTNGNITVIGNSIPSVGSNWSGMTYNPANGKIYAIAFNVFSELYEINRTTGAATLVGVIPGTENFSLIWIAADTNGDMFTMRLAIGLPSQIFKIGLQPLSITALTQNTGFESNFAQDAAIDSITGKLFLFGTGRPIGSSENFAGQGLWNADKITGNAALIGPLVQSFNQFDGLTFAGKEYRYQWSPSTGLDNPNAPNPVFNAPSAGSFIYTLTVTDLCGNTSSDQVVIIVNPAPEKPVITPASAILNHRNAFTATLAYTPIVNINYQWQLNGVALTNSTNNQTVNSGHTVNDRFTVLATNPTTGCTNISTAVQPVFSAGVLLNDNGSYTVCDTSYYDAGGATGNTASGFTQTFTPASAGRKMAFTIYNLQLAAGNTLAVYDGNTISAPRIVQLTSAQNGMATQQFTASNADGVLTIQYTTGATTSIGWFGGLTCVQPFVFRTINNGNWNTAAIWQSKSMGDAETAWTNASRSPVKSDDSVYIRHTISITSAVSIDPLTINHGAILSVDNGGSMVANKVNSSPEIIVQAGGLLRISAFRQITGDNAIIDAKGNVENSGTINVSEVRFTGNAAQQLTSYGTNGILSKLVVQNPAGIGIVGIHEIAFIQFVNGVLFTNLFNTVIVQAFAGASAASHINGSAKTRINTAATVQQIPIGENGNYRPVSIRANNAAASGGALIVAEVLPGAPFPRNLPTGLASISEVRYYTINVEENPGNLSNFVVTLSYGADDGVSTPAFCKIAKDDGADNWLNIGGNASQPAPSTITSNVINSWGDFVLAFTAVAPIPVSLVSFTAQPNAQQVVLHWKVDNEINFLGYGVERSVDGRNFMPVSFVPMELNRLGNYQYLDPLQLPLPSQIYYRLKLKEQNGTYRYSTILRVRFNQLNESNFSIYPNPTVNQLHVQYWAKQSGNIVVQLFNTQTQLVSNKTVFVSKGQNAILLPTAHLPRGMYFITCTENGQKLVQRFVKQ